MGPEDDWLQLDLLMILLGSLRSSSNTAKNTRLSQRYVCALALTLCDLRKLPF